MPRVAVAAALVAGGMQSAKAQVLVFHDDFNGYANGTPINSLIAWDATNTGSVVPYVSNSGSVGFGVVQIRNSGSTTGVPAAFLQPIDVNLGTPASWPFARTCEDYLRLEFDVAPTFVTAGTPVGAMGVYFGPAPHQTGLVDLTSADPFAALVISWTKSGASDSATARIYARSAVVGATAMQVGGDIAIGSIATGRRFRIDFGYEYFTLPHSFTPGIHPPSQGNPWANLRLSWFDSTTNQWILPNSGVGQNGWIQFGTATKSANTYGAGSETKTLFDAYDWGTGSGGGPPWFPVYVHWYADQGGASGGEMNWTIDNVDVTDVRQTTPPSSTNPLQAFSIMSNEVGYDTAGPQWVAMRPNDPQIRGLGAGAVSSLTWTLYDSNGNVLRSAPTPPLGGDWCFQEVVDPETSTPSFTYQNVYWWRWEWAPIRNSIQGCYVVATGTPSGTQMHPFSVRSDPFDIQPGLIYSKVVAPANNIAAANGLIRRAYSTNPPTWTKPSPPGVSTGWFDAANENGENRAHGTFVSSLCLLLRQRRPELSTAEVRLLVSEIQWGSDFLMRVGSPENNDHVNRQQFHSQVQNPATKSHHLSNAATGIPQADLDGHVWHEHQTRYRGYTPAGPNNGDRDDADDRALRVYLAALGLFDAARTLKSYAIPSTSVAGYFTQADNARIYLYALPSGTNDLFIPNRAQCMLDVAAYDYSGLAIEITNATNKMVSDLQLLPPSPASSIEQYWVVGGLFSNKSGVFPQPGTYACVEPLLYFVEHGIPDVPPTTPPHATWQGALNNVAEIYYHQTVLPGTGNPLRITRNWHADTDATLYQGDNAYNNGEVAIEAFGTARLAQNATRTSPNYDRLVSLSVGDVNWLLGLHHGVLSRHVISAPGLADTDLEFSGASFLNGVGSRYGKQIYKGLHSADWTQVTTLNGVGGELQANPSSPANWPIAPWEFSSGDYGTSESFVETDGPVLAAVATLDGLLHPRGVIEAENYSARTSGTASTEANNDWSSSPTRPNGGISVVNLQSNDTLLYGNVLPPEPLVGGSGTPSNNFNYTPRLRAANYAAGPVTVNFTISSPGYPTWTGSVSIPPTGFKHEYAVVSTSANSPILMHSGTGYSILLQFQGGPCSIDDLVLISGGVMQ